MLRFVRPWFSRKYIVSVAALGLLLWVAARAVMDPLLCWDPWMYHVPFSILLWDLGGGAATTHFPAHILDRLPFGVVAEWLQGALWALFGSVNFVSLVNVIPLYALFYFAWRWLGVSWIYFALITLSMPIIAIQATSGGIDLMVGSLLVLSIVAALQLIKWRDCDSKKYIPALVLLCVCTILASNAKFVATPLAVAILALTFLKLFKHNLRARRGIVSLLLIICSFASAGNMIRNLIVYHNPVYPFAIILPGDILLDGIRAEQPPSPPPYLDGVPGARGLYFLASMTELDWLIDPPQELYYSEASQAGDKRDVPRRTGGLFGPLIIGQLLLLGLGIALLRRRAGQGVADPMIRHGLHYFLLATCVYMIQPNSFETRYSLAWPLVLSMITGMMFSRLVTKESRNYYAVLGFLCVVFLSAQLFLPLQRRIFSFSMVNYYPSGILKKLDPAVVDFLNINGKGCIADVPPPYSYDQFNWCLFSKVAYAPAFTGGNYEIEFEDCTLPKPPLN